MKRLSLLGVFCLPPLLGIVAVQAAAVPSLKIGAPESMIYAHLQAQPSSAYAISVTRPIAPDRQITAIVRPRDAQAFQAVYELDKLRRLQSVTVIEDSPQRLSFRSGLPGAALLRRQFATAAGVAVADDLFQTAVVAQRIDGGAHETLLRGPRDGVLFSEARTVGAGHHMLYTYCITVSSFADAKQQYRS